MLILTRRVGETLMAGPSSTSPPVCIGRRISAVRRLMHAGARHDTSTS